MRQLLAGLIVFSSVSLLGTTPATAASYTFEVIYSGGGVATLAPGSDDPLATNLVAGDTFTYRLKAEPEDFWTVFNGGSLFPFFSLRTDDSGTRTANFNLTLFLDGAPAFAFGELGIDNSFAHIGTNAVTVGTGLIYDEYVLQYSLIASTSALNRPSSLLPWPGVGPEQQFPSNISYTDQTSVPEPASLTLIGLGLGAIAAARRRRRQL